MTECEELKNRDSWLRKTEDILYKQFISDKSLKKLDYTFIHWLIRIGSVNTIQYVLEKDKSEVNKPCSGEGGDTPLHYATYCGSNKITKLLLEYNANPNITNMNKILPIHYAAQFGYEKIMNTLIDFGSLINNTKSDNDPLHLATMFNHVNCVKLLVERKANINALNILKCAPLHYAAQDGYMDIMKILLENKADVNIKSKRIDSPLALAVTHLKSEAANYLVENNSDISILSESCKNNLLNIIVDKKGNSRKRNLTIETENLETKSSKKGKYNVFNELEENNFKVLFGESPSSLSSPTQSSNSLLDTSCTPLHCDNLELEDDNFSIDLNSLPIDENLL